MLLCSSQQHTRAETSGLDLHWKQPCCYSEWRPPKGRSARREAFRGLREAFQKNHVALEGIMWADVFFLLLLVPLRCKTR